MGILRHSPIRGLEIYMVSLNQTQWLTLLGGLNMVFLEDIELEGNIPRPALTRFLIKHKGLKNIHIRGNMHSGCVQPSQLQSQPVLPNLLTLHAPLAVCCDIVDQVANSSSLYELQIETQGQLSPGDIAVEGGESGDESRMEELLDTLCKAKPTLRVVFIFSGSLYSRWTADA
ncbi:hypothetical protein BJV78DRAFT_1158577 [Lactifluus subvellereus]|nr:hypothetical protein BJV78DRAFT_1158577 [Lactifluus subvellereus]